MVAAMTAVPMSDAEQRVWARLPEAARVALTEQLSASDLQTLLLSVAGRRAAAVRPAQLLRRWREDRFVRPAACSARALAALEGRMWQLLPEQVDGVELAPVVPLGTCRAVSPASQNRIVTTMRLTEVVSDSTNALAVEAALRRRAQPADGEVHLAASHRQLRAQVFPAGVSAHFRLFALVSSARDAGSGTTEARLLTLHLRYWRSVLAALVPAGQARLSLTVFDSPVLRDRLADTVAPALAADRDAAAVAVVEDPAREHGRGYYVGCALRLSARDGTDEVEFGDGGFTTWTAQLMGNAKERCLVSCLSTERLLRIAESRPEPSPAARSSP